MHDVLANQQNHTTYNESIPYPISQPHFHFEHIGQKQGLKQKQIKCITQDSHGFLWLGTSDGLVRYDGYEFRTYRYQLADSVTIYYKEIHSIFEDSRGWLWIGASGGLICYSFDFDIFVHLSTLVNSFQFIDERTVHSIIEDTTGAIWLGTGSGLIRLVLSDKVNQKTVADRKKLFGKFIQEPALEIMYNQQNPMDLDNSITSMLIDSRGVFLVGTENGLSWLLPTKSSDNLSVNSHFQIIKLLTETDFKDAPQSILKEKILGIHEDKNTTLWVLTLGGLVRIDKLVSPKVKRNETSSFVDKHTLPIVGQINNSQSFSFKEYPLECNKNIGLAEGALCEFSENKTGIFWIGRQDHPLVIFNSHSETYVIFEKEKKMCMILLSLSTYYRFTGTILVLDGLVQQEMVCLSMIGKKIAF